MLRHRWFPLLLGLLAFAVLWTLLPYGTLDRDEGWLVDQSWRLLHGEIPHRDSHNIYPVARYILVAGLMALTGTTVVAARLACAALEATTVAVVFGLGRTWLPPRLALGAALTTLLLPGPWHKALYGLVPLVILWVWTRSPPLLTGLVAGFGFWWRQDTAIFALVAIVATELAASRRASSPPIRETLGPLLGGAALSVGAGLLLFAPWVSPLHLLGELLGRAVTVGMPSVSEVSAATLGARLYEPRQLPVVGAILALTAALLLWAVRTGWVHLGRRDDARLLLALGILAALASNQMFRSNIVTRFLQTSPPLFLLAWTWCHHRETVTRRAVVTALPLCLLYALVPASDHTALAPPKYTGSITRWMQPYVPMEIDGHILHITPMDADRVEPLTAWLRGHDGSVLLLPGPSFLYATTDHRSPGARVRWHPDEPSGREAVQAMLDQGELEWILVQRSYYQRGRDHWQPLFEGCCTERPLAGQHRVFEVRSHK